MPIIKSAIKRAKQQQVRRKRNLVTKQNLKSEVKQLQEMVNSKGSKTPQQLSKVYSAIDIAVKKNVIHKNKAARLKAQASKSAGTTPKASKAAASATKKPAAKKAPAKKTPVKKPAAKKAPAKKS